jgi:hypothetical protein
MGLNRLGRTGLVDFSHFSSLHPAQSQTFLLKTFAYCDSGQQSELGD